jgi:RHS repeat-associated protein
LPAHYDDVGNRTVLSDSAAGTTAYQYDNNDRLLSETGATNATYTYDGNGNTKSVTQGGQTTTYTWDNRNRMISQLTVNSQQSTVSSYTYNDENIRVSSKVGTEAATSYLVDSNRDYAQVLAESKSGTIGVSYVYGNDLISQKRGTAESFYLVDGLGSTRGLTNAFGGLTDSYTYDAFGNLVASTGGTQNSYLFAGEQYDSNLDQYYLRQRFYDAGTGRFTRRDDYEGDINSPISLHKYIYGNANPVFYTDPSGYQSLGYYLAAITVIGTLANIFNPFNVFGVDIASDDLFDTIDPTKGLGGQINFDPIFDFIREDILYRAANQISKSRNVAVFEYIDDAGKPVLRAAENITEQEIKKATGVGIPGGIHSEKALAAEIEKLGIPKSKVTKIYTEFEPCNRGQNTCSKFLKQNFPKAKVYWSYPYNQGMNDLSRIRKYNDLERYGVDHE